MAKLHLWARTRVGRGVHQLVGSPRRRPRRDGAGSLSGGGQAFDVPQPAHGLLARGAAHLGAGLERTAHGGAFRLAEELAAQDFVQVRAGHAGGFALWQAGQGR